MSNSFFLLHTHTNPHRDAHEYQKNSGFLDSLAKGVTFKINHFNQFGLQLCKISKREGCLFLKFHFIVLYYITVAVINGIVTYLQ